MEFETINDERIILPINECVFKEHKFHPGEVIASLRGEVFYLKITMAELSRRVCRPTFVLENPPRETKSL